LDREGSWKVDVGLEWRGRYDDPESAHLLGVLIHDVIDNIEGGVDVVGGLELGAVPLTGIAIAKAGVGSTLRGFIMRKEPKGRGGRKTGNPPGIEGSTLLAGDRVVILEDVTTTGGSALKAVERLQQMGCIVVACISIVDRQEGGAEAFEAAGVPLIPLSTLSDYDC
jgi:orotate phosphoribosyltransferase